MVPPCCCAIGGNLELGCAWRLSCQHEARVASHATMRMSAVRELSSHCVFVVAETSHDVYDTGPKVLLHFDEDPA
jgi:hypothetical protein